MKEFLRTVHQVRVRLDSSSSKLFSIFTISSLYLSTEQIMITEKFDRFRSQSIRKSIRSFLLIVMKRS